MRVSWFAWKVAEQGTDLKAKENANDETIFRMEPTTVEAWYGHHYAPGFLDPI